MFKKHFTAYKTTAPELAAILLAIIKKSLGSCQMHQIQIISGFSELKDLLIEQFQVKRPREMIRLHFTISRDRLLVHDYNNHQNVIPIVHSALQRDLNIHLKGNAKTLCLEALTHPDPALYLNEEFQLYGFFRL